LLKQGRIIRGYLGIQTPTVPRGQAEPDTNGVVVQDDRAGSPAAEAQLQPGDVIRKFNGREVKTLPELRSLISQVELGKKVEMEIVRNGKPLQVATEIKEQPIDYQTARVAPRQPRQGPGQQTPQVPQTPQTPDDEDNDLQDEAPLGWRAGRRANAGTCPASRRSERCPRRCRHER
jgi:membrane-associated protease RseP (regulator of RpoE activity)